MMAFDSDQQDLREAVVWYGKAATQGNTQAQAELARLLDIGLGVKRNPYEAAVWRRQAEKQADEVMADWAWKIAASGRVNWQVTSLATGKVLQERAATGSDIQDRDEIVVDVQAVRRDAEQGDKQAKTVGAFLLATGAGMKKDERTAIAWLREAAIAGDMYAQAALGELLMLGWGPLEVDPEAGAQWMKRAAVQGLREAKAGYGAMLASGKGVKENKKESFDWIRSAAQENEPRVQLMMAMNALAKDNREEAAQWFYRAAEYGDDEVLSILGVLYGWGVARDIVSAERWFWVAAQHDDDVWLPLGFLYAETGRLGTARGAFDTAAGLNVFSFACDTGLLQLIFGEPARADAEGMSGEPVPDGRTEGESMDSRQGRIAKKVAFLEEMASRGNPAAERILATLLEMGWGVPRDRDRAVRLRAQIHKEVCATSEDRAERNADFILPDTGGVAEEPIPNGRKDENDFAMRMTDYFSGENL